MAEIFMKRNDTSSSLSATLAQDAIPVDLSDPAVVVKFHMGTVVNAAAVVVDGTSGIVRYDWKAADTVTAGRFPAEFEVTYADETVETFPNNENLIVVITEDVA